MDEYIADILDSQRFLALEEAVDEYISGENDLIAECTTEADRFVDTAIDGISNEELDAMIDADADGLEDYIEGETDALVEMDDEIGLTPEEAAELNDVNAMLDLEPEVDVLADEYDDCDVE